MELPIDTSSLTFMCALSPRAVTDEGTDQPVVGSDGQPLYAVSLVVLGPEGAQVLAVNFAGQPAPGLRPGAFVTPRLMAASLSWIDDRPVASFTAAGIEVVNGPSEHV